MKSKIGVRVIHGWLLAIILMIQFGAMASDSRGIPTVCFRPSLDYQTASAGDAKGNFESFISHCPKKIYRKWTYENKTPVSLSGVPDSGSSDRNIKDALTYDDDTGLIHRIYTDDCTSSWCSGSYYLETLDQQILEETYTGDYSDCLTHHADLQLNFSFTWDSFSDHDPSCESSSEGPMPFTDTESWRHDIEASLDCEGVTGSSTNKEWYVLADEYTTEQLIDHLKSKLTYSGTWTSGDAGSTALSAAFDLSADETTTSGSKFKFKLSFQTKTNCHYTIRWTQKTDYDNTDCADVRTTNSSSAFITKEVEGNGGTVTIEDEAQMPGDGTTITISDFWVCCGDGCEPAGVSTVGGGGNGDGNNAKDDDCDGEDDDGDGQVDEDCDGCDGQDNDGDGEIDEDCNPGGGGGGDDDCEACKGGKECSTGFGNGATGFQDQSLQAEFALGTVDGGATAGRLAFGSAFPSRFLSTPDMLRQTATNSQTESIRDSTTGYLRQVKAPQGLADVIVVDAYKYQIKFFGASNVLSKVGGLYQTTNLPAVIWTIQNPSTNVAGDRLYVIEDRGGLALTNDYVWESANMRWKLTHPNNARAERVSTSWDGSGTVKTETLELLDPASGQPIQTTATKFQYFDWGPTIIEKRTTVSSASRVTTYEYWTNQTDNGYGRLKKVIRWDGQWSYYEYDSQAREIKQLSGFLSQGFTTDTNLCRAVFKDYTTLPAGSGDDSNVRKFTSRTEVESLLGKEIRRIYRVEKTYESQLRQCQTAAAAWNASDNLVTITKRVQSGAFENQPEIVQYPDGTLTRYEYGSTATDSTTTNFYGKANGTGDHITVGRKTVTISNKAGMTTSTTTYDYPSLILTDQTTYGNFDEQVRHRLVTYLDSTTTTLSYDCCGLQSTTDRDGVTTSYTYDELKRRKTVTRLGITTTFSYGYTSQGSYSSAVRTGTNSSQIVLGSTGYDAWGQLEKSTNSLGYVSTNQYWIDGSGQLVVTNWFPDGSARIQTSAKDGALLKITGTGVHPLRYDYGVEQDGGIWRAYTKEIKLDASFADTSEWTKTYTDMLGRAYKTVYSDGATSQSFYNGLGQLWKQTDPDGLSTLSTNINYTTNYALVDMNANSLFDWSGPDRVTATVSDVVSNSTMAANVRRTRTYIFPTDSSTNSLLASTVEISVDGLKTWTTRLGLTNKTQIYYAGGGTRNVTNTAPDGSYVISVYSSGRISSVTRYNSSGSQIGRTTYGYDAHGRQSAVTDARNGATTYAFDDADQVTSVTTPPPGTGQAPQSTASYYDNRGRVWKQVLPDSTSVTNEYYLTGELKRNYGSRSYPVGYAYDAQGRLTKMTNWSGFSGGTGVRVTTWQYDGYRGFLTNKLYDGSVQGPSYTYKPSGRLWTRLWARGTPRTATTNFYNNAGELSKTDYSDSTADESFGYDRRGRQTTVTNGTMVTTLAYNDANQALIESYSGGVLSGLSVTNGYDTLLRRSNLVSLNGSSVLSTNGYGYDNASRLTNIADGTYSAGYVYLANSPLVSQITLKSNTTTRMTTTKAYDFLNRLQSISSAPGAANQLPLSYVYQYNDANQRTRVTLTDGSFWIYGYDALGQVRSGKKYWSDSTPVAGQQFEYGHDDIGNRTSTKAGGDANGTNLRSATYTANNLNQYTSRGVPNAFDVLGIATASANVTVNGSSADYRRSEYFQELMGVNNSSTSVWQSVSVIASGGGSSSTNTGNVFVPTATESYGYDLDGNMTNDGRWNFTWDAENRLVNMTSLSSGPPNSRRKLDFTYDHRGRRIQKIVSTWNGSSYVAQSTNKFVYDGWNLIAELNNTNGVIRSYVWGLDLSGSEQGAGGVGGLLAIKPASGGALVAAYDGNGNVTGLIDATTGTTTGSFEYGPFGETIRLSPNPINQFPFRFSTKYGDDESDLVYYGRRHLNTSTGRWLNRDSIGEEGGMNEFAYVRNNPLTYMDALGNSALLVDGTVLSQPLKDGGNATSTTIRQFNEADKELAGKGLCMVRKLIGRIYTPFYHDFYVAKQGANGFTFEYEPKGTLTITPFPSPAPKKGERWSAIKHDQFPSEETLTMAGLIELGKTVAHEADHYFTGSSEAEAYARVDKRVDEAKDKASKTRLNEVCKNGGWTIRTLLDKYACECCINKPEKKK